MSHAWEVTIDDIKTVCNKHDSTFTDEQYEQMHDAIDCDLVETMALGYTDFDDQVQSALNEIEVQLIMDGWITDPVHFPSPENT